MPEDFAEAYEPIRSLNYTTANQQVVFSSPSRSHSVLLVFLVLYVESILVNVRPAKPPSEARKI